MTDAPQFSWTRRRRFMYLVALLCAATIVYCLVMNLESRVAETAVSFSFVTLLGMVGSYVFGAVWQDISTMKASFTPPLPKPPRPKDDGGKSSYAD